MEDGNVSRVYEEKELYPDVYEGGFSEKDKGRYVIKELSLKQNALEQFLNSQEYKSHARLAEIGADDYRQTHIIPLLGYEVVTIDGKQHVRAIFPLVEGKTLGAMLFNEEEINLKRFLEDTSMAMDILHKKGNITHLDLHEYNVMVSGVGEDSHFYIFDLGMAITDAAQFDKKFVIDFDRKKYVQLLLNMLSPSEDAALWMYGGGKVGIKKVNPRIWKCIDEFTQNGESFAEFAGKVIKIKDGK
jgi:hypothetical protein